MTARLEAGFRVENGSIGTKLACYALATNAVNVATHEEDNGANAEDLVTQTKLKPPNTMFSDSG